MTQAMNFAAIAVGSALIAARAYAHHIHHIQTAETDVQTFEWAGVTYLVATGKMAMLKLSHILTLCLIRN